MSNNNNIAFNIEQEKKKKQKEENMSVFMNTNDYRMSPKEKQAARAASRAANFDQSN